MTWEPLVLSLVSGLVGWGIRHFGIIAPANAAPQSRPAAGGTSPPAPAQADWRAELRQLIAEEIQRGLAALASGGAVPPKGA